MYLLKKVFELREKAHSDHEKPFLEHMEDLRVMIARTVSTLLISMVICFCFQKQLMNILRAPAEKVIVIQQRETMPDGKSHPGIKVPTVEVWDEAKKVEGLASSLSPEQREIFYLHLAKPDMEFHARSVTLLRAAKALPEEKQKDFVNQLGLGEAMTKQLLALLESDPDVNASAGANIRMMSALKPTETFMLSMKLSFFAGIVLAFPLLLLFILQFILPGLHEKERKVLWPALLIGFGLFLSGILFAYYFVLPTALKFFYEWSKELGVSNDWRIGEYITFATQFTLLFGVAFELPVVVMVLVKLGLLSYEGMSSTRTYSTVAIFIAAAIITPTPDAMTLLLMALPMLVLYEICIWLAWFQRRKERRLEKEEEEAMKARRQQWLLQIAEREEAHKDDPSEEAFEDDFHEYKTATPSLPEDEEWTNPDGVVTDHCPDSMTEEGEKKRPSDSHKDD